MAIVLQDSSDVTSLMLRNTGLDDYGLERITTSVRHNCKLQYLNLNCNDITANGVQHVVSLMQNHPQLGSLAYVSYTSEVAGIISDCTHCSKLAKFR